MLREHEINKTNPFIRGYYTDTGICEVIIEESKRNKDKFFQEPNRDFSVSRLESFDPMCTRYWVGELAKSIQQYKQEFEYSYKNLDFWTLRRDIKINHYAPGQSYANWHCENNGMIEYSNRHLVYMTYLNDVDDGGETEFFHQKLSIKPEVGLTLIWPADWTHTHRGIVSNTQEKYLLTGWLVFDNTKAFIDTGETDANKS
jgi:hypothetical protein